MNILKPVIAGMLFGAAIFFLPFFILRIVAFFLIISLLFRLFTGRRFGGGWGRGNRLAFTDNIRNMSDEEYNRFKQNFQQGHGWHRHNNTPTTDAK